MDVVVVVWLVNALFFLSDAHYICWSLVLQEEAFSGNLAFVLVQWVDVDQFAFVGVTHVLLRVLAHHHHFLLGVLQLLLERLVVCFASP